MLQTDIWDELEENGFQGLETFIDDDTAFDVISYNGAEYSWLIREWEDDSHCRVTASYDSDNYFETSDEALAGLVSYIAEERPEYHYLFEEEQTPAAHPFRRSLHEFCQKAMCMGFAITTALVLAVSNGIMTPDIAMASPDSTYSQSTDAMAWNSMMLNNLIIYNATESADRVEQIDEHNQEITAMEYLEKRYPELSHSFDNGGTATLSLAADQDGIECVVMTDEDGVSTIIDDETFVNAMKEASNGSSTTTASYVKNDTSVEARDEDVPAYLIAIGIGVVGGLLGAAIGNFLIWLVDC